MYIHVVVFFTEAIGKCCTDLVWDSEVLDGAASNEALWHPPELVSVL